MKTQSTRRCCRGLCMLRPQKTSRWRPPEPLIRLHSTMFHVTETAQPDETSHVAVDKRQTRRPVALPTTFTARFRVRAQVMRCARRPTAQSRTGPSPNSASTTSNSRLQRSAYRRPVRERACDAQRSAERGPWHTINNLFPSTICTFRASLFPPRVQRLLGMGLS